jgi:hypothetical protein
MSIEEPKTLGAEHTVRQAVVTYAYTADPENPGNYFMSVDTVTIDGEVQA